MSYHTVPSLLTSPSTPTILTQWRTLYERGKSTVPVLALLSAACSIGNARGLYHPQATYRTKTFIAAAAAAVGIVPWTLTAMIGTNNELMLREEAGKGPMDDGAGRVRDRENKPGQLNTRELVLRWAWLNAGRGALMLVATWLSFEAL